jgi:hypothetical protein
MSCGDHTLLEIATLNVNGLKQSCQKVWDAKYDAANVLHLLEHLDCGEQQRVRVTAKISISERVSCCGVASANQHHRQQRSEQ